MAETRSAGGADVVAGIAALVIAGLAWVEARTFPLQNLQEGLGAAFFPWSILAVIVALGLALTIGGLTRGIGPVRSPGTDAGWPAVAGLFLAFSAFALAFAQLGLLGPLIAFLVIAMRLLGAPWIGAGVVGVASGCALYALFVVGFTVPMP